MLFDEYNLTAVFDENPDGTYTAHIPEIDGIKAEGKTLNEAEQNLLENLKVLKLVSKRNSRKKYNKRRIQK